MRGQETEGAAVGVLEPAVARTVEVLTRQGGYVGADRDAAALPAGEGVGRWPSLRAERGVTVCAAVAWETIGDALAGFVEHYVALGAHRVVLYDISDRDGVGIPERSLAGVANSLIVVVRLPRSRRTELAAMRLCHRNHGVSSAWYLFVVAPERVELRGPASLPSLLEREELRGADAVLLGVCAEAAAGTPCDASRARAIVRAPRVSPVSTSAVCARHGGVVVDSTGGGVPERFVSCAPWDIRSCARGGAAAFLVVDAAARVVVRAAAASPLCAYGFPADLFAPHADAPRERRTRRPGDEDLTASRCGVGVRLSCDGSRNMAELSHEAAGLAGSTRRGWTALRSRRRAPRLAFVMVAYGDGAATRVERAALTFDALRRAAGARTVAADAIVLAPAATAEWTDGRAAAALARVGAELRFVHHVVAPAQCRLLRDRGQNGSGYLSADYLEPGCVSCLERSGDVDARGGGARVGSPRSIFGAWFSMTLWCVLMSCGCM